MMNVRCLINLTSLCLLLALFGCSDSPEIEEEPRPVRYVQVFTSGGERTKVFSGVARAGVESRLSFKVTGTLNELPVTVGDHVQRGQTIARLDDRDYRIRVQEADASLIRAKADARNVAANYERVRSLYESNNASRTDLDQARASSEVGDAAVQTAEKQLELVRLQLSYTRLRAPVEGDIASIDVEVNENVVPGQIVVMLTSGAEPEVEVAIPEALIARISRGDAVRITLDAVPGRIFEGVVQEAGISSIGLATTFPVTLQLKDPESQVRPGMAAQVAFQLKATDDRESIFVPPFAIGEDRNGRFAYIVEPADEGFGIARRRNVQVGELTDRGLEILEGLIDGDLVVTAGVSRIQDGLRVKLTDIRG